MGVFTFPLPKVGSRVSSEESEEEGGEEPPRPPARPPRPQAVSGVETPNPAVNPPSCIPLPPHAGWDALGLGGGGAC